MRQQQVSVVIAALTWQSRQYWQHAPMQHQRQQRWLLMLLAVEQQANHVSVYHYHYAVSLLLLLLLLCCLVRSRLQLLPLHAATLSAVLYCSHYCCCVLMQGEMLYCVVH
jgi:hypothetical protein